MNNASALRIGILEGDDIGLEVVPETIKVMRAGAEKCALAIDWHPVAIGRKAYDELGYTLPPGTLEKLDTLDGWVLGPIGHQAYPKGKPNAINPHPILRKHYDLFANVRPAKSLPGLPALYSDVDLVIAIRTGIIKDGILHVQAGAGIVADSVPQSEWVETKKQGQGVAKSGRDR